MSVLQLESDAAHHDAALALTESLRRQLAQRFTLRDSPVSYAQLAAAEGCDTASASCAEGMAQALEVDGLVYGELSLERGRQVVALHHFERGSGAVRASAWSTLDAGGDAIDRAAAELLAHLFGEAPVAAPVAIAPAPMQPMAARRGVGAREITGYSLLGAATLSSGMALLSFAQIDRAENSASFEDYRRSVGQMRPNVRDVCDEVASGHSYGLGSAAFGRVKSDCAAGRTFEVLQYVFIGGAVLAGGVSAYLLLAKPLERVRLGAASLELQPTRAGAAISAHVAF